MINHLIFVLKSPPVPVQLLETSKQNKGSAEPNRIKISSVTWEQVKIIAEDKDE
jgi:large subunit ribosomal protein L11